MSRKSKPDIVKLLDDCADRLDYLNKVYPKLASEFSHEAVQNWRKRKDVIRLQVKEAQKKQDVEIVPNLDQLSTELLEYNSLEDVLDILLKDHGIDIPVRKLVKTVGKKAYLAALRKEVVMLRQNSVSFSQIADLWNDLDRPGPNSDPWTKSSVSLLGR